MPTAKQPAKAAAPKYCPRCLRTEGDVDECVNKDFPGHDCPPLVEAEAGKDVPIKCGPCGFTRIVPVKDLLSGRARANLPTCRRDSCAAQIV